MKKLVSLLLLSIILLCGCKSNAPMQPHQEDFIVLENYILDVVGDDIHFTEPDIKEDYKMLDCGIDFTYEFAENAIGDDYIKIMEEIRCLINDYLLSNPDYFLNGYAIRVSFYIVPSKGFSLMQKPYEYIGTISNYLPGGKDTMLTSIDYEYILTPSNVMLLNQDSIVKIDISSFCYIDEVKEIIDATTSVKYVDVNNSFIEELSEYREDIEFY